MVHRVLDNSRMTDLVEQYRRVSHDPHRPAGKRCDVRPVNEPGTYREFNDVHINQLSRALLHLYRKPLPEVFLESVLEPPGGGRDFCWEG